MEELAGTEPVTAPIAARDRSHPCETALVVKVPCRTSSSDVSGLRLKLNAQRVHHLRDGVEARIAFATQCFVETLTPHASAIGELGLLFGAGHVAQSLANERSITVGDHAVCFVIFSYPEKIIE